MQRHEISLTASLTLANLAPVFVTSPKLRRPRSGLSGSLVSLSCGHPNICPHAGIGIPGSTPAGWLRRIAQGCSLTLLAALSVAGSNVVRAQAVSGVGSDAIPLARGAFRFSLGGLWNDYDEVFSSATSDGPYGKRGILSTLQSETAGVGLLASLSSTQDQLRELTGQPNYRLSLGPLSADGQVRQSIAPITVEYGLSRRFSLRLMVPYAESRDIAQLLLNRNGSGANVGLNPATMGAQAGVAAIANGALRDQLDAASGTLYAEIQRCYNHDAGDCDAIRANPARALALSEETAAAARRIANIYGTPDTPGQQFVPILGSEAQNQVASLLARIRSDYEGYGISTIPQGAQPLAATNVLGPGGMERIATDSAFGVGYERIGNTRRAGIGDVELTASALLYDSFNSDPAERLQVNSKGLRTLVSAGWRFGTAGADRVEDAFDVPIGEGANAILLRSSTDLVWSKRFWMSATLRTAKPLSDHVAMGWPFRSTAETFMYPVLSVPAARSLGMRTDLELAPRVALGDFFGLSAAYVMRRMGKDRYDLTEVPDANWDSGSPPTRLEVAARTLHAASWGVTFSTLASYARHRSRIAAEITYTHTVPITGSGGVVPAVKSDRLELRIYTGFPRR